MRSPRILSPLLLAGKVSVERVERIHREIDASNYTTSDPRTIIDAKNAGLVGEKTASVALGFDEDEHLAAREGSHGPHPSHRGGPE